MTPLMDTQEIAQAFNAATERQNWKAYVGGSRTVPTVIFKSRSAMVELTYYPSSGAFAVLFSKATCAFGDFMASAHRAVLTVLTALKASGYPVSAPLDDNDGVMRTEYDPRTKVTYVSIARLDDAWQDYAPTIAADPLGTLAEEAQVLFGRN